MTRTCDATANPRQLIHCLTSGSMARNPGPRGPPPGPRALRSAPTRPSMLPEGRAPSGSCFTANVEMWKKSQVALLNPRPNTRVRLIDTPMQKIEAGIGIARSWKLAQHLIQRAPVSVQRDDFEPAIFGPCQRISTKLWCSAGHQRPLLRCTQAGIHDPLQ